METIVLCDEIVRDRAGHNLSVWWSMLGGRVFRVEFSSSPNWFAAEAVDLSEVHV